MAETFEDLLNQHEEMLTDQWRHNPARQALLDYVKRLEARQITSEMWALLDEAKAAGKEGSGGREFFRLRDFLNQLETLRVKPDTPDAP